MFDVLLLAALVWSLSSVIFESIKSKNLFFTNCWLIFSFCLFILYHIFNLANTYIYSRNFCVTSGVLFLNLYFAYILSNRSDRLFDKVNSFVSNILLYLFIYFLIREKAMSDGDNLHEIILRIIMGIVVLINIINYKCMGRIKMLRKVCTPILLFIICCGLEVAYQDFIFEKVLNLGFSTALYLTLGLSYKDVNNFIRLRPQETI